MAGYSALISAYDLKVPVPDYLCAIGPKHKKYDHGCWHIFTPRHKPVDTLFGHLTFALKYEGIDLAILKALFQTIEVKEIQEIICSEPTGSYSRRLWFLWEWLREEQLDIEDARAGNFVFLVNSKLQCETVQTNRNIYTRIVTNSYWAKTADASENLVSELAEIF